MSNKQEPEVNQNIDDEQRIDMNEEVGVISPGQILSQAREKLGLTQQDIAKRLNFRITLVQSIEQDIFDPKLPETFTRGYLCSYAKTVHVSNQEILSSYELLSIAKDHCAEMQSFSKTTQKEAQNSLLTWTTYLIIAILLASTVIWWLQDIQKDPDATQAVTTMSKSSDTQQTEEPSLTTPVINEPLTIEVVEDDVINTSTSLGTDNALADVNLNEVMTDEKIAEQLITEESAEQVKTDNQELTPALSKAIFTFSGDCWVSIYDATGERIAYGVKKTGYVMTISGVAPFKVDVGRPALTQIEFDGQAIDMSRFDEDNIAKFTLPLDTENTD